MFAFPFQVASKDVRCRLCIKFIACAIGIGLVRAWGGKWETLFEWQVIELCNE